MKRLGLILTLAALAGCGVDGDPVRPTVTQSVTIGSDGVSTATEVNLRKGPVTVSVGL